MKKLFLSLIFVCLLVSTANAQVLISLLLGDKLNSDKLEFGMNGGFNFSNLSGIDDTKTMAAFHLGFYFDIFMSDKLSFNPSVLVLMKQGTRISNVNSSHTYPTGNTDLDPLLADAELKRQINYFQVPLLFKYKLSPKFHLLLGPQPALRHQSRDLYKAELFGQEDLLFATEIDDDYTRLDFGFTGGMGWRIVPGGMTLGVKYYQGMVDVRKNNTGDKHINSSIYAYFTVPVGKGKAANKEG